MRKKQKQLLIGGIILVVLIALIVTQTDILSFSVGAEPNLCSGGQVLSLSNAQISTIDSPDLGKKVIRATFSTIPSGECLRIRLPQSELESKLPNFDATSDVFVDIQLISQDKVFNINQNDNQKFFKIGVKNLGNRASCTDGDCQNQGVSNPIASLFRYGIASDCFCYYEDQMGVGGEFASSNQIQWQTEIKVGNNPPLTLSNTQLSGKIGNLAFVKWAGNLQGNDGLDRPNRDTYKPFSDNQFRMVLSGTYNLLNQQFTQIMNTLNSEDNIFSSGCSSCIDGASAYNTLFDEQTREGQHYEWMAGEPNVDTSTFNSNKFFVLLKSPVSYPQFTVDIDAKEVGIFITGGDPEVTCPSTFNFISGESKTATFKLKNKGTQSGSFTYSITCNKGSQVLQPSPPKNILASQTLDITGTIGLTVIEGTDTATCTFKAQDQNNLKQDTCSFSYSATHQSKCTEGTLSCEDGNKQLWECLSDGSYKKTPCKYGCEGFENSYRCRLQSKEICDNEIDDDGNGLIDKDDPQCKGNIFTKIIDFFKKLFGGFFGMLLTIKYILIGIASLVALFFARDYSLRFKDLRRNNGLRWLVSLGVAGLVGYLAYRFIGSFLFWVIVIGIVLFKAVIGGYLPKLNK